MPTRNTKATKAKPATKATSNPQAKPAKPVYLAVNPCKPYAVKAKHNQHSWQQLLAAIASGATLAQMGQANGPVSSNVRFARYCLRRGWVVTTSTPAKATKG